MLMQVCNCTYREWKVEDAQINRSVDRAIEELRADFLLASQFLVTFMSLERMLLRKPGFRRDGAYVISWDSVVSALASVELAAPPDYLCRLCGCPPKEINADGTWPNRAEALEPTLANALECLRRMRNNLAHGSKGDGENDRNNALLKMGLMVLAYIDSENIARRLVEAGD